MELGQTRDLSEPFKARRSLIHRSVAKDVERVMSRFQMVSLTVGSAPVQHSGYSFWKKPQEPGFVNLLDDDSLNPEDVVNCPICREEFRTFSKKKKEKCLICSRIVCSTCHANTLPIKGAVDGVARELKLCTTCFTTITKEQKRIQLKHYFENSAKSGFTTFYEEMFFLVSVIQRDLPKLRHIMESPLTASSLKKAKELDVGLGKTLTDFEREIKNLEHFQVNTKKQQQLRDAIKMGFITSLTGTGPEYKLLHRQLETAASQPLAPEPTDTPATKPLVHHSRSHSATHAPTPSQATPAPTMTPVLSSNKDKRRTILGSRLSSLTSLTSLFTGDAKSTTATDASINSETGPYISGINPVLSPMSGGIRITILGDRFNFKCGVQIGEVDCPVIERGPGTLVVLSPAQERPEAQDVCVYNPSGERCVMEQMLFYADDSMFAKESPTVPEANVYNLPSSQLMLDDDDDTDNNRYNHNNKHNTSNNNKTIDSPATSTIQINNVKVNSKQDNISTTPTTPPMLSSSSSNGRLSTYTPREQVNGFGRHQTSPTKPNEVAEEISLVMIKPVMSPLQGTRVTLEVNHPLPFSSLVKVGGKTVQSHISEENPCEVSFVSPPLPSGFKNIEIVLGHGKTVLLENILQYENLIPQTDYANVTHRAAPSSSGRVWGKKA